MLFFSLAIDPFPCSRRPKGLRTTLRTRCTRQASPRSPRTWLQSRAVETSPDLAHLFSPWVIVSFWRTTPYKNGALFLSPFGFPLKPPERASLQKRQTRPTVCLLVFVLRHVPFSQACLVGSVEHKERRSRTRPPWRCF